MSDTIVPMKFMGTRIHPLVRKLLGIVMLGVIMLLCVVVAVIFAPTLLHRFFVLVGVMCLAVALWRVLIRYHDLVASKQHQVVVAPLVTFIYVLIIFAVAYDLKWGTLHASFFIALEVWLMLTAVTLGVMLLRFPTYISCTNCSWKGDIADLRDRTGACPRCRATQSFLYVHTDTIYSSPVVARGFLSDIERVLKEHSLDT